MTLFGYLGGFPGSLDFDSLDRYGSTQGGPETVRRPPGTNGAGMPGSLCRAPWIAQDEGVTVALLGQPFWVSTPAGNGAPGRQMPQIARSILDAYRRSGTGFLESLAGGFSLAILDHTRQRALLAIDPLGIERMAYAQRGNGLVFSTSAEAVARFPAVGASLNRQAVFNYLLQHVVAAPETIFSGVAKLRAGTCASFERGRLEVRTYWQPQFEEGRGESFESLRSELMSSLRTAVAGTAPDERTGAFLSGGLDSSSVAGVLSEVGPRPTRTFSIGFGYEKYDELSYARIANARFGCQGTEYTVSGADIASTFPLIAREFDEPFGNSSALPVYYCAKVARENGVEHLLAGDGGDEIFAGNSRYAEHQVFERYKLVPAFLRRGVLEPLLRAWPDSLAAWPIRKGRGYVQKANTPLPTRLEAWNLLYQAGAAEFLHADFLATIDPQAPFKRMHEVWDATPARSTLNHMLYYDWQYTLADNDLRKVQTMSSLAGVRVSYPMLHPAVVAMSNRVPPHLKMAGMNLRHFYKLAMTGYLPDEIINKKKHGFGLPFGLWLQESAALREQIFGNLSSLRARRIIRSEFIDRLLHLHGSDDASFYGVFVWVLAMLEQWLQAHAVESA
jgi:asparagine synthase (glutamine-hydrolysing)